MTESKVAAPKTQKLVILDCDGVLYPTSQLTMQEMVEAFKKTCRQLDIPDDSCKIAGTKAKKKGHLGIFNYILHICRQIDLPEEVFFKRCIQNIDYSRLTPAPEMLKTIREFANDFPVCVLTNNHALHLAEVLDARFGSYEKNFIIPNYEKRKRAPYGNNPIPCYDITSTANEGGWYQPKQSEKGFKRFLRARGVLPQNAVLLDDTPKIIDIARKNGMRAKLVSAAHPLEARLKEIRAEFTKEHIHG